MDFALPAHVVERKKKVRTYVEQVLDPISPPMEEKEMLTNEVLKALRETEFFGLTIPQQYGGKGWRMMEWFPVLEEWAKAYAMIRLLASQATTRTQEYRWLRSPLVMGPVGERTGPVAGFKEVERGFDELAAQAEADRCFQCGRFPKKEKAPES